MQNSPQIGVVKKRNTAWLKHAGKFKDITAHHIFFGVDKRIKRKGKVNCSAGYRREGISVVGHELQMRVVAKALSASLDAGFG
jgi:hypothetical protein